jgi:hypothetical protein
MCCSTKTAAARRSVRLTQLSTCLALLLHFWQHVPGAHALPSVSASTPVQRPTAGLASRSAARAMWSCRTLTACAASPASIASTIGAW